MNRFISRITSCLQFKLLIPILFSLLIVHSPHTHSTVISDLLITEIMANPNSVTDSNGEWFELYNPSNDIFDFNGTTLSDNGNNTHVINQLDPLLILPGDYFIFGRNGNKLENGGYIADYVYSNFVLGNSDDEIILTDLLGNILSLEYGNGLITAGHSIELTSPNMLISNFTETTNFNYGDGDYGTPGNQGSYTHTTVTVPEPSSVLLFLAGIIGIGILKKKSV